MDKRIVDYFDKQPPLQKEILEKIRKVIQDSAPLANEAMSYGVPAFKINGHLLVAYAAFKQHVGLYPEPDTIIKFEKELNNYSTSKGAIQFSLDHPIPCDLIESIVKYRISKLLK